MSNIELFQNGDNGVQIRNKINNSLTNLNQDKAGKSANLSDLASIFEARGNLDVDSRAEVDAKITSALDALKGGASAAYDTLIELQNELQSNDGDIAIILTEQADRLKISSNLSDLSNVTSARTNLSVDSSSEVDSKISSAIDALKGGAASAYDTLLELQNAITNNDTDIVTILNNQANKLDKSNNLSDLTDTEASRSNLDVDKTILSRAMTAAEFHALAEHRKNTFAGSGFVDWGKVRSGYKTIAPGLFCYGGLTPYDDSIVLGSANGEGDSNSDHPIVVINGVQIDIAMSPESSNINLIKLPSAPDGLDKNDGTRFADLNAAILAGGNGLTASVTKRTDPVYLRVKTGVDISAEDAFFPMGNRQFSVNTWEGIALQNTNTSQSLSALGVWDLATKGYSAVWSGLTAQQQAIAVNNPINNIRNKNGALLQDQFLVEVTKSLKCYSTIEESFADLGFVQDLFDKGLWHDGDDLIIPIVLVTRLNQGAYHPFFNPDGTTTWWDEARVASSIKKWHETDHVVPDVADCFKWYADDYHAHQDNGSIGSTSGRSDGKFYDAIYADQVHDLRNSAHKISPQELLEVETRKAIAGDYRGWERVPYTKFIGETVTVGSAAVYDGINSGGRFYFPVSAHDHPANTTVLDAYKSDCWLLAGDNGATMRIKRLNPLAQDNVYWPNNSPTAVLHGIGANDVAAEFNSKFPVGTKLWIGAQYYKTGDNYFETLPMTNIIGSPQKIVDLMTAKGWTEIQGEWIPVVPDGTGKEAVATRKAITDLQSLSTTDNGATWSTSSVNVVGNANSFTTSFAAANVWLVPYTCRANGFELASNKPPLCIKSVIGVSNNKAERGARLLNELISNVVTGTGELVTTIKTLEYAVNSDGAIDSSNQKVMHSPLALSATGTEQAGKAIPYITEENGRYYFQCIYRQAIWGGADWGDDNTFTVISNETVITDDNGALVLVGQKRRALPYFKGGN